MVVISGGGSPLGCDGDGPNDEVEEHEEHGGGEPAEKRGPHRRDSSLQHFCFEFNFGKGLRGGGENAKVKEKEKEKGEEIARLIMR